MIAALFATSVLADATAFAKVVVTLEPSIDPETGHYFDATKRYIDQVDALTPADKHKIVEGNARKVYPRINARIAAGV